MTKIISITTSSLTLLASLTITSTFPINAANIKSAALAIASARKMDFPPVCQPMKKEKGKSYKENMEYHRGTSWKAKLRVAVDKAIWSSINYDEFLQKMQLAGYEIRQGKNLSFRAPEQKNFTYMKSLGNYYTEENVRARLEKNRYKTKTPKHLSREARLYINISTYITTGNESVSSFV